MASMQSWVESILIMILVVGLITLILSGMNALYDKNYTLTGLNYQEELNNIQQKQESIKQKIETGEVTFLGSLGMTLSTSWSILLLSAKLIWNFVGGSWIDYIVVKYMKLPVVVAIIFRTIYLFAIGFIILRVIFKVKV